jgi:hypothetical protein
MEKSSECATGTSRQDRRELPGGSVVTERKYLLPSRSVLCMGMQKEG